MSEPGDLDEGLGTEIAQMVKVRVRILTSVVLDCLLLLIWLAVIWFFDNVAKILGNPTDLSWVIAYYLFGVATVAVVVLFLFWDVRRLAAQLKARYKLDIDKKRPSAGAA